MAYIHHIWTGRALFVVFAAFLATTCGAQSDTAAEDGLAEQTDHAVQTTTGGGYWGSVLVARNDHIILAKGYGNADYRNRSCDADTLYEIASVSKQFTAAGILRLQQQGKLDIDASIGEIIPDVPEDKQAITIHQLLTHTSGLSPNTGLPYVSRATRDELVEYVMHSTMDARPGTRFAYCNIGYSLLAAIIEIVSDQSFEHYMHTEIFDRAGLEDTGFIGDDSLDSSRMSSRLSETMPGATAAKWHWSWGYRGMGGVVTSVRDLYRWDRALRGNDILNEEMKAVYFAPVLDGYACGWSVGNDAEGALRVSHSGGVEGYGCLMTRGLDNDTVIICLSNGRTDLRKVQHAIDSVLSPPPNLILTIDIGHAKLNQFNSIIIRKSTSWQVSALGENIVMKLLHPDGNTIASLSIPRKAASAFETQLAGMIANHRVNLAESHGMEAGVYLNAYPGREQPMTLEGVTLDVMPRYKGVDADGHQVIDHRLTLIVRDDKRHFWPVMCKMDHDSSEQLLHTLQRSLNK